MNAQSIMIFPSTFEQKIGFPHIKTKIIDRCHSNMAKERVENITFSSDFDTVKFELSAVDEMLGLISGDAIPPLGNVADIEAELKGISLGGSMIAPSELLFVRKALESMKELNAYFCALKDESGNSRVNTLDSIASGILTFPELCRIIDRVLDRYGNVKDSASAELADLRRKMNSMSGAVNAAMRRVMTNALKEGIIDADASPSVRDGRLVIPVAPMNKRRLSGIVHDESASGKTVYIEPAEVVEANNRLRELQMEERREIARIISSVCAEIRPYTEEIAQSNSAVGEIDFINAKSLYARSIEACMPSIHPEPELEWYHACHPVLKESLEKQGKEIVPLYITLGEDSRILIVSGPNAGGKSACLKTVGIVQYMLQCGLLPPLHENSHCGIFRDIFMEIGDNQSIEDDLSTYSSHLRDMKEILAKGSDKSLVLIDEFGTGTEPQIGGAIAQAVLEQFHEKGMWGVITTHYQNLKHYAEETPGLVNGSMLYDRHLMQPLFKLSIGNAGSSFALEIARKIGLPKDVVANAEAIVGSDYVNLDKYLLDIARDKRYWENKRQQIRLKEKKLDDTITRYEEDADNLRAQRREIISDAKEKATRIIEGSNALIERTIHEIRKSNAEKEKTLEAREQLKRQKNTIAREAEKDPELLRKAPKKKKSSGKEMKSQEKIAVGDTVKLDGGGVPGRVLEINGENASVNFGMLKTTVKLSRLKKSDAQIKNGTKDTSFVSSATNAESRQRQLNFKREIDVRGMRVDEAVQAVTYFIDDAIQFGAEQVRILHGTGTGALRQYIRDYLKGVNGVKGFRDEHVQFGGAGITVVELS